MTVEVDQQFSIELKTLQGGLANILVPASFTVSELKDKIEELLKIDSNRQRLIWKGKALASDKFISDYFKTAAEGPFRLHLVEKPQMVRFILYYIFYCFTIL